MYLKICRWMFSSLGLLIHINIFKNILTKGLYMLIQLSQICFCSFLGNNERSLSDVQPTDTSFVSISLEKLLHYSEHDPNSSDEMIGLFKDNIPSFFSRLLNSKIWHGTLICMKNVWECVCSLTGQKGVSERMNVKINGMQRA